MMQTIRVRQRILIIAGAFCILTPDHVVKMSPYLVGRSMTKLSYAEYRILYRHGCRLRSGCRLSGHVIRYLCDPHERYPRGTGIYLWPSADLNHEHFCEILKAGTSVSTSQIDIDSY